MICQQMGQSISQDLQQKLDCLKDAIGARLDHLSTICNHLAQSNAGRSSIVVTTPSRTTTTQSRDIDRSMNVMLLGRAILVLKFFLVLVFISFLP